LAAKNLKMDRKIERFIPRWLVTLDTVLHKQGLQEVAPRYDKRIKSDRDYLGEKQDNTVIQCEMLSLELKISTKFKHFKPIFWLVFLLVTL
jgi:hypothetical protein